MRFCRRCLGLLCLLTLTGCSSETKRKEITGQVTYDGSPVPFGIIYFEPDRENDGPQGVGEIRNGRYKTNADFGAVNGTHAVRISGYAAEGDATPIFPEYKAQILIAPDKTSFDFEVPKKKGK